MTALMRNWLSQFASGADNNDTVSVVVFDYDTFKSI